MIGVTLAIVITVVLTVASFLTREVSDWEAGIVAAVVNGSVDESGSETLFQTLPVPEAGRRWQTALQRVERRLPGLVRCKVWTRDQIVLWSDSPPLIGARSGDNPDLRTALGGQVVVRLVEPALDDAKEAWRFSVLTRVYVPVTHAGVVQAVVELRRTPSRLARALLTELSIVAAVAAAGGVVLWLVIRPLARSEGRRLSELEARATELAEANETLRDEVRRARERPGPS